MGRRSKSRGKSGRRSASTNSYKNASAASRAKSAVNKSLGRSKTGPTNSQVTTGGSTSVQRADPKNILDEFLQGVNRKTRALLINMYKTHYSKEDTSLKSKYLIQKVLH